MASVKDFSIEDKLSAVLTLQKVDSKIDEIKTLKGELPMEVKDMEDEIAGLKIRIENIDKEIEHINVYIDEREEARKESLALVKKYEKQQDNVKNNREFEALNKEIEMQGLEAKLQEKHIKDSTFELKERQAIKVKTEEKIESIEVTLKLKKKELEKIIVETEKEEKEYAKQSNEASEKVDSRLFSAYSRIRSSFTNGLAVVAIQRDSCGGCFNIIPPQRQSEIKQHKKIIVCEHCGRILVDQELNEKVKIKS